MISPPRYGHGIRCCSTRAGVWLGPATSEYAGQDTPDGSQLQTVHLVAGDDQYRVWRESALACPYDASSCEVAHYDLRCVMLSRRERERERERGVVGPVSGCPGWPAWGAARRCFGTTFRKIFSHCPAMLLAPRTTRTRPPILPPGRQPDGGRAADGRSGGEQSASAPGRR